MDFIILTVATLFWFDFKIVFMFNSSIRREKKGIVMSSISSMDKKNIKISKVGKKSHKNIFVCYVSGYADIPAIKRKFEMTHEQPKHFPVCY